MADFFLGEIRLFAGDFAPDGWALCNGQTLAISTNMALFALLGTSFGGDGQNTFNLPDLRGRVPVHIGSCQDGTTYKLGESNGAEQVTVTLEQLPVHNHTLYATNYDQTEVPFPNTVPAVAISSQEGIGVYGPPTSVLTNLDLGSITMSPAIGYEPHANIQPYVALTFIIALEGVFPSRN